MCFLTLHVVTANMACQNWVGSVFDSRQLRASQQTIQCTFSQVS